MLAVTDTAIAAQNAVTAAWSLGIGSCYIGDILEQVETHRTLLRLPEYVVPAALLVFGYPTQQQQEREKPAAAPWSTSSTRTPTAAWSRPSWRLCWPTTPEPGPTVRGWTPSASASTTPISPARCPAPWPSTSSPFCRKNARSRFWLETGGGIAFSSLLR